LATLRNETLSAAAQVRGVKDWLATKLSQLDIGYRNPQTHNGVAGTRIDRAG
jgi:hypothetical protein